MQRRHSNCTAPPVVGRHRPRAARENAAAPYPSPVRSTCRRRRCPRTRRAARLPAQGHDPRPRRPARRTAAPTHPHPAPAASPATAPPPNAYRHAPACGTVPQQDRARRRARPRGPRRNRTHPGGGRSLGKAHRPGDCVAVGQRERGESALDGPADQVVGERGAVAGRVPGGDVQVREPGGRRSYLRRLAWANGISANMLTAPSTWLSPHRDFVAYLSTISGQPRESLLRAIPLLDDAPRPLHPAMASGRPCRLCVARRTGQPDSSLIAWRSQFHDQVCLRHHRWLGHPDNPFLLQADLRPIPDVVQAFRRHRRLLHRHGPALLDACYEHCSHLWRACLSTGLRSSSRERRLRLLQVDDWITAPADPRWHAADYPEIVQLLSLCASRHWRSLATTSSNELTLLLAELRRRLPGESELTSGIAASSALRVTFRQRALRIDHALVQSDHSSGRGCALSGPGQDESAPGHHGARGDDAAGVAEDLAVEAAALHTPRVAQDQRPVGGER